jgi:hypothetical protein
MPSQQYTCTNESRLFTGDLLPLNRDDIREDLSNSIALPQEALRLIPSKRFGRKVKNYSRGVELGDANSSI